MFSLPSLAISSAVASGSDTVTHGGIMTDNLDVERVRRETPGCIDRIHLDNAGSALPPQAVLDAVIDHLGFEARVGGYEAADAVESKLEGVYASLARLLNCNRDEVALVENATRAWDMAFYSLRFREGDRILTARAEYASNVIAYLQVARRTGVRVEVVPNDHTGQISVEALESMIDDRVKLIAITHVPTQGGLVNPAREVGRVARRHGIPYLLDACQAVGQMSIDVEAIGCDMLSGTGRKFLRGPRGTGFLYVRRTLIDRLEPPFLDLHAATWTGTNQYEIRPDARRFENWEGYVAGKIGLGVAVDYALSLGIDAICHRARELAARMRAGLASLPGVEVHDLGVERCAIVSFTNASEPAAAVKARLRKAGIGVSISSAPYARLDFEARGLTEIVRASPHYYNTEEEIDRLVAVMADGLKG